MRESPCSKTEGPEMDEAPTISYNGKATYAKGRLFKAHIYSYSYGSHEMVVTNKLTGRLLTAQLFHRCLVPPHATTPRHACAFPLQSQSPSEPADLGPIPLDILSSLTRYQHLIISVNTLGLGWFYRDFSFHTPFILPTVPFPSRSLSSSVLDHSRKHPPTCHPVQSISKLQTLLPTFPSPNIQPWKCTLTLPIHSASPRVESSLSSQKTSRPLLARTASVCLYTFSLDVPTQTDKLALQTLLARI